jgi:hypothetical protein
MDTTTRTLVALRAALGRFHDDQEGFSTAELLGNAALGIIALIVIWGAMRALGLDIVEMIRAQLL